MPINPFVVQRREMLFKLLDMIKRRQDMEKKQLIAFFGCTQGLKKQRVEEYWEELEESGLMDFKKNLKTEDGKGNSAEIGVERDGERIEQPGVFDGDSSARCQGSEKAGIVQRRKLSDSDTDEKSRGQADECNEETIKPDDSDGKHGA